MVFSIAKMHLTKKLAVGFLFIISLVENVLIINFFILKALKLSLYQTDVDIEKTEVIGARAVMDTQEAAIV